MPRARRRAAFRPQKAGPADLPRRVMRDERILAEPMGWRRRVAEAFLRHEGGAEPAPRLDAETADGRPPMRMASVSLGKALAGEDREEFALAVAGDAGDADDFAGAHRQLDSGKRHPVRAEAAGAEPGDPQHLGAVRVRRARAHLADLGADHEGGDLAGARGARIEARDDPAAAQDRGAPAQAPHLLELVRDVEDRAALARAAARASEQALRLLRRQHRGRLVEDEQLRILQQAAHDLDALALACGERPHRPVRLEREAVVAR